MNVFNDYVFMLNVNVVVREVPERSHTKLCKAVDYLLCNRFRYTKNGNLRLIFTAEFFKIVNIGYCQLSERISDNFLVGVEYTDKTASAFFKVNVNGKRSAEITRTEKK